MFYFGLILTHLWRTVSIGSVILFSFIKTFQSSCFSGFTSWNKKVTFETLIVPMDKDKQMNQYLFGICRVGSEISSFHYLHITNLDYNDDMSAQLVRQ